VSRSGSALAWLSMLRISNAPTVVSQVFAGAAVGCYALPVGTTLPLGALVLVLVGVPLSYLAGMILNDVFDAQVDATERPDRPIPSGRISLFIARFFGVSMLLIGISMLAVASPATLPWAIVLGVCILGYDVLHTLSAASFVLMASCRGLVPVIAAFAMTSNADWSILTWTAGAAFAFIAAVSIAARNEMTGFGLIARAAAWSLPVAACAPLGMWGALAIDPGGTLLGSVAVGATFLAAYQVVAGIRTASKPDSPRAVPVAVAIWIGAMPAIDAATCFLLGSPTLGVLCLGMLVLSRALRPRFAGS
jgi:4-hydroxybenzoate polyprenyltransferase